MNERDTPDQPLVLVTSSLAGGGAERVLLTMAEYWANEGRKVVIVTLRRDAQKEYLVPASIDVVRLQIIEEQSPVWDPRHVFRLLALRRALLRLNPSVVISYIDKLNAAVLLAMSGTRVPIVATEHLAPWMNPLGPVWERLRAHTYPKAKAVVSPTQAITDWFKARMQGNFVTLPYPAKLYTGPLPESREKVMLGVGRLAHQKGFDLLIDAFASIASDFPEWRLEIAGEGPERTALEQQIARHDLHDRVTLLGQVEDVWKLYLRSEIFVLSSRHEAYPMVLCEAMSAGCCVVATDCPTGPREIVGAPAAGLLVPPEDSAALATALDALLRNSARRDELRAQALTRARQISAAETMKHWDTAPAGWLNASG